MTMILPGFNEEAQVKRFSKRLRKILLDRGVTNVPTLTQMHDAVAQSIGHASWYAAEQAWAANPGKPPKRPASPIQPSIPPAAMVEAHSSVLRLTIEEQDRLCQALANLSYPNGEESPMGWRVFRFAAVLPTQSPTASADIHVAIVPKSWERHGLPEYRLEDKVREAFNVAGLEGKTFELHRHEWSRWPIAWKDTLLGESNAFPTLVVFKQSDGGFRGALMAKTMVGDAEKRLKKARSKARAKKLVEQLQAMDRFADYHGWFKQSNFEASTLQNLISKVPKSKMGQFSAWIFEDDHWKEGLYHLSDGENLRLYSQTKPSSHKPLKSADLLELLRKHQTVPGDWTVLKTAIRELALNERDFDHFQTEDFESRDAVRKLCAWWNSLAPQGARKAGCFRFYVWNPTTRTFNTIGEAQEPDLTEDSLKNFTQADDYTLFEEAGKPTVLALFLRGRKDNCYIDGGTQVYQANGTLFWEVGTTSENVNEAHVSVMGLADLQDGLRQQWRGWVTQPQQQG